jgi:hypothetical protein
MAEVRFGRRDRVDPYDASGGRSVVGKLKPLPQLMVESITSEAGRSEVEVTLRPLIQFVNSDTTAVACVIQRMDASVWAHTRVAPQDMIVGSDEWNAWAGPDVRIIPERTHAWKICWART